MNRQIYILGAGGLAKELGAYVKHINSDYLLKGFFDDTEKGEVGELGKVHGKIDQANELEDLTSLLIGVGEPALKKELLSRIKKPQRFRFPNFIQPGANISDENTLTLGLGSTICSGCSLTTSIRIGDFVIVNLNTSIGHDVDIGKYSSVMPGANISGNVVIGESVYLGAGAVVLQGINIGDGAIVGAGAVVTRDVPSGTTVVGIPAAQQ